MQIGIWNRKLTSKPSEACTCAHGQSSFEFEFVGKQRFELAGDARLATTSCTSGRRRHTHCKCKRDHLASERATFVGDMSWPSAASGARTHASASASSSSSSAAVFTLPSMLPAHAHGTPIRMPKRHHHLANAERAFEVPPQAHQSLVPPTTSRYFSGPTTRVCAPNLHQPPHQWQQQQRQPIVVGPPAQVQLAPSTGAPALHLKTLFFASQRGGHLRALLRHADPETPSTSGATPTSAASSLFRLPQLGLYELFTVKAASNLLPDLLVSGPKSVAFLLATEKELAKEANRDELVQRSAAGTDNLKRVHRTARAWS